MGSTNMNSWRNCNFRKPDEAALDTSYIPPVMQESDAQHLSDKDQPSGTCIFSVEKPKNDSIIGKTLQQNESCSSFHDQSYPEKIKEFQFYIDMVKRLTRPGCSAESLDVALSSISSLVKKLSAISSEHRFIRSSL